MKKMSLKRIFSWLYAKTLVSLFLLLGANMNVWGAMK